MRANPEEVNKNCFEELPDGKNETGCLDRAACDHMADYLLDNDLYTF
jgi:hypothetical protein